MQNIKKIYSRLTESLVKNRTLLLFVAVQNIILALIVLIYANVIISNGKINGELNYSQVKFFYNFIIYFMLFIIYIFTPYFLASSINKFVKSNTIEYLLSEKVRLSEITYAAYVRGVLNIVILIVSSFPIACVSLYFGGVGLFRAFKLIVFLMCFAGFFSAICVYISSIIKDVNSSLFLSYVIGFFLTIINIYMLKYIINSLLILFMYIVILGSISIALVFRASKCPILRR